MTRKELILIFSCFVTILAVTSYFAHLDPDWHHDGILFKPAVDVAAGLSLFKETFTQYGALTTYLQAGAVAIFGEQLIVLRLQAAGFLSLSGVLLYLIVSRAASTVRCRYSQHILGAIYTLAVVQLCDWTILQMPWK